MRTYTTEIMIDASTQDVFAALTRPELIGLWQYGRMVTTDWRVGGEIKFRTAAEGGVEALEQWGKILDVRPNELIKYSLFTPRGDLEDKPENYCLTSYGLVDEGGRTKVELIHEDNRPTGFAPATLQPILVALKRVAEDQVGR